MSSTQVLETVDAVIDVLGGIDEVQKFTFTTSAQVVYNWRSRGNFPAKLFKMMNAKLESLNCVAPAALWAQVEGADDIVH